MRPSIIRHHHRNSHALCACTIFIKSLHLKFNVNYYYPFNHPTSSSQRPCALQSSDIIIATPMRCARSLLIVALKFNVIGMTKLLLWPVVVNVPQRKLVLYNGQMYTVSISTPSSFLKSYGSKCVAFDMLYLVPV